MHRGALARVRELPWHVSVGVRQNRCPVLTPLGGHRGGGTIVGDRWVLTAAHCLVEISDMVPAAGYLELPPDIRLRVTTGISLEEPDVECAVTFVKIHPGYHVNTLEYDAALLRVSSDIGRAIAVADEEVLAGECGVIAGWGETHLTRRIVPHLSWARAHVASDDVCARQASGSVVGRPRLMFAAGGDGARCPEFPRACVRNGDSGGGFVVTRDGEPRLCGIISWSASSPADPQVLTRTFPLADWIARETASVGRRN